MSRVLLPWLGLLNVSYVKWVQISLILRMDICIRDKNKKIIYFNFLYARGWFKPETAQGNEEELVGVHFGWFAIKMKNAKRFIYIYSSVHIKRDIIWQKFLLFSKGKIRFIFPLWKKSLINSFGLGEGNRLPSQPLCHATVKWYTGSKNKIK